jgi:hypothetical protein
MVLRLDALALRIYEDPDPSTRVFIAAGLERAAAQIKETRS